MHQIMRMEMTWIPQATSNGSHRLILMNTFAKGGATIVTA